MTDNVPFANYQNEIYLQGLAGTLPEQPLSYDGLEAEARETLDPGPYGYVAGGAGLEDTMRANRAAFARWRIVPRMLRNVKSRSLATTVLNTPMPAPMLLAPVGVQSIIHPDGELASARAAASQDVPFIMSTASSYSIEEVAEANGGGRRWFQLYWPGDQELAASFIRRAEKAGFEALVVTLDTHHLAWRPRDLQLAYLPFLRAIGIANYVSDPVFNRGLPDENRDQAQILKFIGVFNNPTLTWNDLAWLREQTDLPIVLKGIQHTHDARRALDHGMNGIVVSNHGGRQVDGAIGSLDALPAIIDAVGDRMTVLFDSGIRSGSDIFKALAIGARAVLIGRPYVWGLALHGEAGVRTVIRSLLAELDLTLALAGYTSFADVGRNALTKI